MKPRETGGNVPKPRARKVKPIRPTPEVANVAPVRTGPKTVAPEATRPVTVKQRQAIDTGTKQAAKQQFVRTVSAITHAKTTADTLGAQALEVERRMNQNKLPLVPKVKVRVDHGKLIATSPTFFGLSHSKQQVKPYGTGFAAIGGAKDTVADVVPKASKKLAAPGLKVLQATTIPLHAVAGAADQATGRGLKGLTPGQLVKGAEKGIQNKTTYSDVLKTAGVKNKTVRAVAGFAGDVVLDPLTYTTFGTASVAKHAAQKAGEKAYAEGVAKGLSHARATKVAEKAAQKAASKAPQNKGITVTVAGKSTSGKTTATISRKTGLSKVATKLRETRAVQGIASDLRPGFRPKGVSEQQHTTIRAASREARAHTTRGRVQAVSKAQALRAALPKQDYAQVVNAIERGTVYNLPDHLRTAARDVELTFRQARKAEIKAGIQTPNRRQYFAHALEDVQGAGKAGRGGGKRVVKPTYAKGRQHQGTVEQIAAQGGPQFSTNVPSVVADRLARSAKDVAQAKFNRTLLQAGRKIKPSEVTNGLTLDKAEALYRINGANVEKVAAKDERKALAGDTSNLRVLHSHSVDQAYQSIAPGSERGAIGKGYDKLQGGFKFLATVPNPGFHARNLYGDTQNAYLAQPGQKLVVNMGRSAKTLHALGKQETAARTLGGKLDPTKAGIRVKGKYGGHDFITYDQLAQEAATHGAIRSGFLSKEIPELVRDTAKQVSGKERLVRTKRLIQNREDLPRLATYIGARKKGMTPREAADWASQHHFDYADLTGFERTVMRRLLPFYTFSARNIPLQAKKLVTNPGKYANVEKLREEMAKSAGLPKDWQSRIPEYQQRGTPFPITVGGKVFLASPSFPLNDLNQLALPNVTTASFGSALGEQEKKFLSMLNPVIKDPVELFANYNFFFRGPIQRDTGPLVAAPAYVSLIPKAWRDKLGIVPDFQKNGKKGWGWPAKVDYVAKVLPGPTNIGQQIATPLANRRGQGSMGKLVSYIGGIKPDPYKPNDAALTAAYDERTQLETKRAALRQRGQGSAQSGLKETPAYVKVRNRIKELTAVIDAQNGKKKKVRAGGSLITQSSGPSVSDILGHDAPTVQDILGP